LAWQIKFDEAAKKDLAKLDEQIAKMKLNRSGKLTNKKTLQQGKRTAIIEQNKKLEILLKNEN
jgi:mRNA-degrading endonuclease RelE of RelBE toxin-antitoxin system